MAKFELEKADEDYFDVVIDGIIQSKMDFYGKLGGEEQAPGLPIDGFLRKL
jgi:hypothetical protein